jgi:integrase
MNRGTKFEDRASSSRGKHEGESSAHLCDRLATLVRGSSRRIKIMRFRPANIRLINRRLKLPRLLLAQSSTNGISNDNDKINPTDLQGLTGSLHIRWVAPTLTVERLLDRAHKQGAIAPDHYLIPRRVGGMLYDPTKPPSRWGWRRAWRNLVKEAGLGGLRPHDLRHHAITKLAESPEASEQTIMSIAGHVSREMLEHYSHVRQEAKRRAVESLDDDTITSQLGKWEAEANQRREAKKSNNNGIDWSGRADLNCRPLAPQASALPG